MGGLIYLPVKVEQQATKAMFVAKLRLFHIGKQGQTGKVVGDGLLGNAQLKLRRGEGKTLAGDSGRRRSREGCMIGSRRFACCCRGVFDGEGGEGQRGRLVSFTQLQTCIEQSPCQTGLMQRYLRDERRWQLAEVGGGVKLMEDIQRKIALVNIRQHGQLTECRIGAPIDKSKMEATKLHFKALSEHTCVGCAAGLSS